MLLDGARDGRLRIGHLVDKPLDASEGRRDLLAVLLERLDHLRDSGGGLRGLNWPGFGSVL